jgi:hypothetical protein
MVSSILDIPNLFHSGVNVMEADDVAPECFLIFGGSQTVMFFDQDWVYVCFVSWSLMSDRKVARINVRQLGTIAIATPDDTFLSVIIVGTREEVSKDKFRVPETLLLVHTNTDATEWTIILDGHGTRNLIDSDGDGVDLFGVERVAVDGVDQDFIENFQESWGVLEVLLGELVTIKDPVGFYTQFNWTDIRVRSLENVFDMGEFLN